MEDSSGILKQKKNFTPEKLTFIILLVVSFLLPLFFVPSSLLSFQFSKSLLIFGGVTLAFAVFLISILRNGKLELPKNYVFASAGAIVLVSFVSSLISGAITISLLGYGFELGTFSFISVMFVLTFLVFYFFRSKEKIFYSYLLFFVAFAILTIFHSLRFLFGPNFLSFGGFNVAISNTVGRWNDLGIFFGVGVILSMVTLEIINLSKLFKWLLFAVFVVSLVFVSIVNFSSIWLVIGLFSLIFFVYIFSFGSVSSDDSYVESENDPIKNIQPKTGVKRISYYSLVALLVSVIFLLSGNYLGGYIANKLNISSIEVRPSWNATLSIAKSTLANDPIFGTGPNRFSNNWFLYKPLEVNTTQFWNTDFSYGVGFVPTLLVTTGLLGILVWLMFLLSFLYTGLRSIFYGGQDIFYRYLSVSSFLVSLFLWVMNILYVPSTAIVGMTFFFTGLFFAATCEQGIIKSKTLFLFKSPKSSFISVLVLIVLLIATIAFGYLIFQRSLSSIYFQKSIQEINNGGSLDKAEENMIRAINLSPNDFYFRSLVGIDLIRLNQIISSQDPDAETISDSVKQQFQQALGSAVVNARNAIAKDKTNYLNWLTLGNVYSSVIKIEGAFANAESAYQEVLKRNPHSPDTYLALARINFATGNLDKAKEYVGEALKEKNNYTDAYFLLAQIEIQDKNIAGAVSSVEAASVIDPTNPGILLQLGVLHYSNANYSKAVDAFMRAIVIAPDYANAKYFLGLSYDKLGRTSDAIKMFTDLKESNPDNEEIIQILKNLQAGRTALSSGSSVDNDTKTTIKPEKRDVLPITETPVKEVKP